MAVMECSDGTTTPPAVVRPTSRGVDDSARIEGPTFDADKGVWVYTVESQFLNGRNRVEVLLPDNRDSSRVRRVLYVLPVQPGIGGEWGDGLQLVRQLGSHTHHDLICVSPAFDTWPYYGSHATDLRIRHEEYILRVLVPLIENRYSTSGTARGRLLLGFSKSGWGSILLALRNPEFFGYACSWDAPLMMSEKNFGLYETASHFGTKERMSMYVPRVWARKNATHFQRESRLVVLGRNFFGTRWLHDLPHTSGFHRLLRKLEIKHHYDNSIKVPHTWNHAWMEPAMKALMKLVEAS